MKIGIIFCSLFLAMAVITGCSDVSSTNIKAKQVHHPDNENIKNIPNEETSQTYQEIDLNGLKINVSSKWEVKKGQDSAAFSINGKPAGMIEGLAYADTLEALLPNQSIVEKKQKLTDLPFVAYMVTTKRDAVQANFEKEIHVYIYIEPKQKVYDLHFDAKAVDETTILKIVKTTVLTNPK